MAASSYIGGTYWLQGKPFRLRSVRLESAAFCIPASRCVRIRIPLTEAR